MEPKKKLGRPRARARASDGPVEEEILAAARELFRAQGFSGTSTREIANAAGLRQPTLFHYFDSKTAIMDAIAQRALEPEIQFLEKEAEVNRPPDVALYRYARFVVYNLNTNPNVIGSPLRFPELTRERFGPFWKRYDRIRFALRTHVRKGIEESVFVDVDARIASTQLFAMLEYALAAGPTGVAAAQKAADTAATLVLRALLKDSSRIAEVAEMAEPFDPLV